MPRFTTAATGAIDVLADWPIQVVSVAQDGTTVVKLPNNDPTVYNRPTKVHATFYNDVYPAGLTPDQAVTAPMHNSVDVPAPNGSDMLLTIPPPTTALTPGHRVYMVVGEFAA